MTPEGRKALRAWLAEPAGRGFQRDEFLLRLFFLQHVTPPERAKVLGLEIDRLEEELRMLRRELGPFEDSDAAADATHALRWQLAAAGAFEASTAARLTFVRRLLQEAEETPS